MPPKNEELKKANNGLVTIYSVNKFGHHQTIFCTKDGFVAMKPAKAHLHEIGLQIH